MKIGDKTKASMTSYGFDADAEIISETKNFWRVKLINHSTMGKKWDKYDSEIKLFHKKNLLERGYWAERNTGCFMVLQGERR